MSINKTDDDVSINPLALAADREDAADDLDAAIKAVEVAYGRFQRLTSALSEHVGSHLARRIEVPLILALRAAGLGPFLARQLSGSPVSLRSICEDDHRGFSRQS